MSAPNARTFRVAGCAISVSAFPAPDAFVSLTLGEFNTGQFNLCLSPAQARSLAGAIEAAVTHAAGSVAPAAAVPS